MAISTRLITNERSLEMQENKLEEIVDGEPRLMPSPSRVHALLIERMAEILREQLDRTTFRVLSTPFGLGVKRKPYLSYRVPDLAVYRDVEPARERDHYVWSAPELLVECLSPANRKGSVEKLLEDYALIRAPEVWLIYPEQRAMRAYSFEEDRREQQFAGNEVLTPERLAGARVDLSEIWKVIPDSF